MDENELARRYLPLCELMARRFCVRCGYPDHDDALSAAALGLLAAIRTYKPGAGSFRGFAWRVCWRRMLDARRKYVRRKGEPLVECGGAEAGFVAVEVRDMLDVLPFPQRRALELYYLDGNTLAEGGEILGCGKLQFRRLVLKAGERLMRRAA